jgi:hypothetical protein
MKNITKIIAQFWANLIIKRLEGAQTDFEFDFWMTHALTIDTWCVSKQIYLD